MLAEHQTLSVSLIKKRAVSAFFSLSARQVLLRAFSFITLNIVLASVLPIETLGIFNIATGVITFFAYFSDVGLAASLIQKKDGVRDSDIYTSFTIQNIIVGILSILIITSAPFIGEFYKLNNDGVWLVRILGLAFFLTSLKVIPSVLLERELKFRPVITVELIETLIFNILLIVLTFQGFGIWSFTYAVIVRAFVGAVLIYAIAPIKIQFGIEKAAARALLSYGVPFQLNSLLAVLKDRLVPLLVAAMIGPAGVGLISWAQSLAALPLEFMNVIIRIVFPAFARLQDDKVSLSKAVEKSLFVIALVVYPALFGLAAILPSLINYVVSAKWQPAFDSFYLFAVSTYWAVISTTLTNTLNAIGHVKTTLKLMVMWTLLTWVLTPVMVYFYGFVGVAISAFIISFTSAITIILVKRHLHIRILDAVTIPTICSGLMGVLIYFYANTFVKDKLSLILAVILGGLVYIGLIFLFAKKRVLEDFRSLKSA